MADACIVQKDEVDPIRSAPTSLIRKRDASIAHLPDCGRPR
jgi:hypothetical protein